MTVNEMIGLLEKSKLMETGDNQVMVRDGDDYGEFRPNWLWVSLANSCVVIDVGVVRLGSFQEEPLK